LQPAPQRLLVPLAGCQLLPAAAPHHLALLKTSDSKKIQDYYDRY
jgi:hypothetical protein